MLDERATTAAIRERIDWLLDGTADGQDRVLYYSGHGAQLPDYNPAEKIDHVDECLVPYDFHWTKDSAITDDDFQRYYSALPYAVAAWLTRFRTASAWQAETRLQARFYNWIAFIAPNRLFTEVSN